MQLEFHFHILLVLLAWSIWLFFEFIISFDRVIQILLSCLQALIFCLLVDLFPWWGFLLIYCYDYYVLFSSFFIFIWIFFGVSNSLLSWVFIAWIVFAIPKQAICLCLLVINHFLCSCPPWHQRLSSSMYFDFIEYTSGVCVVSHISSTLVSYTLDTAMEMVLLGSNISS